MKTKLYKIIFVIAILGSLFIVGCSEKDTVLNDNNTVMRNSTNKTNISDKDSSEMKKYLTNYKVEENYYIKIPKNESKRETYCRNFCNMYTHDPCYGDCMDGNITDTVVNSYREKHLASTDEKIQNCISRYIDREGQTAQHTGVRTRCEVCNGTIDCSEIEENYKVNHSTNELVKKE